MLGVVHMAERKSHQLFNDGNGILGLLCKTHANDAVHSLRMTLVAYVVTILTDRLSVLLFVADGTFHPLVIF